MQSFSRIQEIIHDVSGIPLDSILIDSTADQLNLHDLDMEEVVLEVEEILNVLVENEAEIKTIRDLVDCVDKQLHVA